MPIKSIKIKINGFLSHVPLIIQPKNEFPRQLVHKHTHTHTHTDRQTDRQSDYWGQVFRTFPSIYLQGSAQYFYVKTVQSQAHFTAYLLRKLVDGVNFDWSKAIYIIGIIL